MSKNRLDIIIEFFNSGVFSYHFTETGLKYFSLNPVPGEQTVNLELLEQSKEPTADPHINLIIDELSRFINNGTHRMPLDFTELTPFRQRVYKEVMGVQPGEIRTYKDIANNIGTPGAVQAIASAISKNPVSIFLQTHRIIPQKGINRCRKKTGRLQEKLLISEGHDIEQLMSGNLCKRPCN